MAPASNRPLIGMALWLLKGPLPDRIRWMLDNGLNSLAFLQNVISAPAAERAAAAQLIVDHQIHCTYHGNIETEHQASLETIAARANQIADDVLWWQARGVTVHTVGSDPLHSQTENAAPAFRADASTLVIHTLRRRFDAAGLPIAVGIENGFGAPGKFRTLAQFRSFAESFGDRPPKMLMDIGHANIHVTSDNTSEDGSLIDYIRNLPMEILEVHVTDNKGLKDEHFGAGHGNIDLTAAAKAVAQRGYAGPWTIEVCVDILNGKYGADLSNPAETTPLIQTRDAIQAALAAAA